MRKYIIQGKEKPCYNLHSIDEDKYMAEEMEPIFITGHQHPDTDSVVSAIAYAFLNVPRESRLFLAAWDR